jgi:hypothetical protein
VKESERECVKQRECVKRLWLCAKERERERLSKRECVCVIGKRVCV